MWLQDRGERKGFSVVEMMVVIVIIGILAQLGLSRYRVITAKSKQAEAKLNLHSIEEMQEVYFLEHGRYLTTDDPVGLDACAGKNLKNQLGFRPKDCAELRYKYDWQTSGKAIATSSKTDKDKLIYPGCEEADVWEVSYSNGKLTNKAPNVIERCK